MIISKTIAHIWLNFYATIVCCLAVVGTVCLIHYNHWVGEPARFVFFIIVAVAFRFIWDNFLEVLEISTYDKDCSERQYEHLSYMLLLLCTVFALAGLTVSSQPDPNYTIKDDQLVIRSRNLIWENPLKRTTVILKPVPSNFECQSILFVKPLRIKIDAQIKLNSDTDELISDNYIGSNLKPAKSDKIQKAIDLAAQIAMATKFKNQFTYPPTEKQKNLYISTLKEEIIKNLPNYLETSNIEIEQ